MDGASVFKGADSRLIFANFPLTKKRLDEIDFGMKVIEKERVRGCPMGTST